MTSTPNEARHRMSGNRINFEVEYLAMPLIGALGRCVNWER